MFWSLLAQFFLEWEMFQSFKKTKTRILLVRTFSLCLSPLIIVSLWSDNVERYSTAGPFTDDIMDLSHSMMYT